MMNKLRECNKLWSRASDVNSLAVHSQGWTFYKIFQSLGIVNILSI